jgi:hypothetical protein
MSGAPRNSYKDSDARHLAAVARSLRWADEAAERRDYRDALGWLQAVERPARSCLTPTRPGVTRGWWRSASIGQSAEVRSMQAQGRVASFLNCPCCGLSIAPQNSQSYAPGWATRATCAPTVVCAAGTLSPTRRGCRRQADEQTMRAEMGRLPRPRS